MPSPVSLSWSTREKSASERPKVLGRLSLVSGSVPKRRSSELSIFLRHSSENNSFFISCFSFLPSSGNFSAEVIKQSFMTLCKLLTIKIISQKTRKSNRKNAKSGESEKQKDLPKSRSHKKTALNRTPHFLLYQKPRRVSSLKANVFGDFTFCTYITKNSWKFWKNYLFLLKNVL